MSPSAAARFYFVVETIIGVSNENHVTHAIGDVFIGVGGYVVKDLVGRSVGKIGGSRLLANKRADTNDELVVDYSFIVEEDTNDDLYTFDDCIYEDRYGVGGEGELRLVSVLDLAMLVGRKLRLGGHLVAVFDEDGLDVTIHCEADLAFGHVKAVHPLEVDERELFA